MPLEIRELHIKVNVNQPSPGGGAGAQVPGGGKDAEDEKDAWISQCIDEVMQILRDRNER
jgi:hypothetical protein